MPKKQVQTVPDLSLTVNLEGGHMATSTEYKNLKYQNPRNKTKPVKHNDKRLQYSVVIAILVCCFIAGMSLTFVIALTKVGLEDIKGAWGIFTPIITLALGYFLRMDKS